MTYLTLNEINSNPIYAPIGYEDEFDERIKTEIISTIKKMKVNRTLTQIKNSPHFKIIRDLLDPTFLQDRQPFIRGDFGQGGSPVSVRDYQPHYRKNSSQQYLASWNDISEYGPKTHRKDLKENLIEYFDHYWDTYTEYYLY